ncbi:PilN domain-containing protein [Marinobacter salicampi]|uniref:PilN domain-containing protein n=1 Tax=Marinobacter salicampi TaxID=435907 RepID=UPI00140A0595|nr:PilN domain-containing protein [Marinobacter salicampi]
MTVQQVNLYNDELRPRRTPLQATTLAVTLSVVIVALLLSGVFVRMQHSESEARLRALKTETSAIETSVAQLTAKVQSQRIDPRNTEAIEKVTAEIGQRQRLLAEVSRLVGDERSGFSPYMKAMARQVPANLWLTGFVVDLARSEIQLSGRARSGDHVPLYLEHLGQEPIFTGRRFEQLNLQREESGRWIDFHIASDRRSGAGS